MGEEPPLHPPLPHPGGGGGVGDGWWVVVKSLTSCLSEFIWEEFYLFPILLCLEAQSPSVCALSTSLG